MGFQAEFRVCMKRIQINKTFLAADKIKPDTAAGYPVTEKAGYPAKYATW